MKVLLLVNATASSVTARTKVVIQKALSADHQLSVAETSRRGHAARLAQGAAALGTDLVVVLGGDGTLNEAANGLAGSETALAVLPGGSTNVFANTIGMNEDPIDATAQLLGALAGTSWRRIGLGSVNGRYFLFHVGMGLDAAVVAQVERRGALKRWAGHPLFLYTALTTWLRHYDHRRPRLSVRFADGEVVDDGRLALCLNSNPYTFLGRRPLNVAPDADLDRALAVAVFRNIGLITLVTLGASALHSGSFLRRHRSVVYRTDVEELVVHGYGPFPYQVDGDYLGETEKLVFRHRPAALAVVVPETATVR